MHNKIQDYLQKITTYPFKSLLENHHTQIYTGVSYPLQL